MTDDKDVTPGSTATGSGTSLGEEVDPLDAGTTEADVSDGSEQKQPPLAEDLPVLGKGPAQE
jgi:hypothetical protein